MCDQDEIDFFEEMERDIAIVEKKLANIKRKIKPKFFQAIEFGLCHSWCRGVEIVGIDGVGGEAHDCIKLLWRI